MSLTDDQVENLKISMKKNIASLEKVAACSVGKDYITQYCFGAISVYERLLLFLESREEKTEEKDEKEEKT